MKYLSKSEADASFDERFANAGGDYDGSLEPIKSFISSLRTADLTSLIEHCKGMKKKHVSKDMSSKYFWKKEGYNEAVAALISHMEELKKTV